MLYSLSLTCYVIMLSYMVSAFETAESPLLLIIEACVHTIPSPQVSMRH